MAGAELHKLRGYLLGQLAEAEEEQIELRLLTDSAFAEEYDIVVDELTDDYIAGKFVGKELEQVEQHFLKSPERRKKLRFALALKQRKSELVANGRREKRLFGRYLAIAASVLLVVGGSFYTWRVWSEGAELNKGLVALQSAFRDERPLEARISRFTYAPYTTTRGPGTEKIDQDELRRAELTLLNAREQNSTPAVRHALGKVYLAKKQFDKAIREFDDALKGDPKNAQLYSDLGAAWLEKGRIDRGTDPGKGMEELGRSLENLNKALELDPNQLEALFNRALCRQHSMLFQQAAENWREYLKRDATSAWAEEARRNLKLLEDQKARAARPKELLLQDFLGSVEANNVEAAKNIARQTYTSAGNYITESILDSYLNLRRERLTNEAASKLRALSYVAQFEALDSGDRYTMDVERFYSRASDEQVEELITARQFMAEGYANFTSSNLNKAIENYGKAKLIFARIGNVSEASFADYRIGHSYTLQPSIDKARAMFEPLISLCEKKGYRWLLSQCLYAAANLELNQSEYSKALERSNQALRLSEDVHDTNGVVKNLIQLADKYQSLNNLPRSLEFLERALVLIGERYPEPTQVWGVYIAIAFNLNSLNLYLAALEYQKEALILALEANRPLILSRTYEYLGLTYGNLKLFDEAIKNTRLAFEAGKAFSTEASGQNMMAHSTLQLADLYRQAGDYGSAINAYDASIQLYDQLKFQHYAYAAHKGKLLSYLAQANDASTETELQTVLSLFEKNRSKINEDSNRNTFFDLEQQVYDLAIEFAYSRKHDTRRAFEYSESSRARSLSDMMLRSPQVVTREDRPDLILSEGSNLVVPVLPTEMPADAQIVQYSVLDNKLIIWVVTRTDIKAQESNTSLQNLDQKVREYLQTISSASESGDRLAQQARELYSILIAPIEAFLDKKKPLCVVADKILHFVPYAALVSPASGRYLVEDYDLTFAPSSRVFLTASKSARQFSDIKEEKLLSVGDPAFDSASFPSLPRLPAAKKEAESITSYYSASCLLVTNQATKNAVRREMVKANVLHLALHYVPNQKSSLLSRLVLAQQPVSEPASHHSSDSLSASEIYQMKMPRTRLAVLSACQTGIEQNYRGEGAISFARPFLAQGVPLVIASLWNVESDSTAELMTNFHRHRKRELVSSAKALRLAQLDMIANPDPRYRQPYYWASFVAMGGYTEF